MRNGVWAIACAVVAVEILFAAPSVTDVTARQRYPWNGMVDISCTAGGVVAGKNRTTVTATDLAAGTNVTVATLSVAGAAVENGVFSLAAGANQILWDAQKDLPKDYLSERMKIDVTCEAIIDETTAQYLVVDLSAGPSSTSYPVTYLDAEPSGGFNVDGYKTTKLVLKRIEPGSFIMGDDQSDQSHKVTLTKPFYVGLFEVTQKQWTLAMGSNPTKSYGVGDSYPVYYVSYNMIRGSSEGAKWPSSSKVDELSILGKLQAKTGLNFDLPTEAQWEYASRAGTTTTFYWGTSISNEFAWYNSISGSRTHPVGEKQPNARGLYDMSGNVWEWNLDWRGTLTYETDPKGSSSGSSYRVIRGGSWRSNLSSCTSSYQNEHINPWSGGDTHGFRLFRTLP